jgi:hypothetical protein
VTVAGITMANPTAAGGQALAVELVRRLALFPATARRIAHKLCVRFVADQPPAALVDRLAAVYLDHRSAIVPVLRALFGSREFAASVGAKTRTPLEDVAATVRVLGLQPDLVTRDNPTGTDGLRQLYWIASSAGHAPLRWALPDGYPDVAAAWASPATRLALWNGHLNLAGGYYPTELVRPASLVDHLVGRLPGTHGEFVDALCRALVGTALRPEHRTALLDYLGVTGRTRLRDGDPATRWRLPNLIALVLGSPYFSVR